MGNICGSETTDNQQDKKDKKPDPKAKDFDSLNTDEGAQAAAAA